MFKYLARKIQPLLIVNSGKREMTLDQLAQQRPGMDLLMQQMVEKVRVMYPAGRAKNWEVCAYAHRTLVGQIKKAAFAQPKYADALMEFIEKACRPIGLAIHNEDAIAFTEACENFGDEVNRQHEQAHFGFLSYRLPTIPPDYLRLG
jgi:hypothetical protein